jgi:hypothetical protein
MKTAELMRQFMSYSERLDDVVVGDLDYSLRETISNVEMTFNEAQSEHTDGKIPEGAYSGIELEGVTVDRDEQDYFIATADDLGYAKIYYVQNLVGNMLINSALESGKDVIIEDSDLTYEEGVEKLANSRQESTTDIHTKLIDTLSESDCEFYYSTSDKKDIISFQVSQKVFAETSLQEYDRTVQQVINTGLSAMNDLTELYSVDGIKSHHLKSLNSSN